MSWLYVAVAAAAVIGGTSAYAQNRAQQRQLRNQAVAQDYNAKILKQRADSTAAAFNAREENKRRLNRIEEGKRSAAIAQSGTGFVGSNLDFAEQQDLSAELDALNIRYEGRLESQGLLSQSSLDAWDAENMRTTANDINRQGTLQVAGAAIQSGASVYTMGISSAASSLTKNGGGGSYGAP